MIIQILINFMFSVHGARQILIIKSVPQLRRGSEPLA